MFSTLLEYCIRPNVFAILYVAVSRIVKVATDDITVLQLECAATSLSASYCLSLTTISGLDDVIESIPRSNRKFFIPKMITCNKVDNMGLEGDETRTAQHKERWRMHPKVTRGPFIITYAWMQFIEGNHFDTAWTLQMMRWELHTLSLLETWRSMLPIWSESLTMHMFLTELPSWLTTFARVNHLLLELDFAIFRIVYGDVITLHWNTQQS